MLYNLPENFLGGAVFLRLRGKATVTPDDYFWVMKFLRPLLARDDFSASTPGFYINYIRDTDTPTGALRLNYFSVDACKTLDAIEGFARDSGSVDVLREDPDNNRSKSQADYNQGMFETEFKNFLDANTRICLDMLENFGEHYFESLVAAYRFLSFPVQIPPRLAFEECFIKHSRAFNELRTNGLDTRFWDDLVRDYPDRGVGLHFMVNLVTLVDGPYDAQFHLTLEQSKELHKSLGQWIAEREDKAK